MRRLPLAAAALVLALASPHAIRGDQGGDVFDLVGRTAPLFQLRLVTEDGVVALREAHGHVVVLLFLSSRCDPCRQEMPEIVALAKKHPEVAFIGVAIGSEDVPEEMRKFSREFAVEFPMAMGNEWMQKLFHTRSAPSTFILDGKGVIANVIIGRATAEAIEDSIKSAEEK
ncbi:MAG TPA: TlpA disulfide reductase family protein [Thermoanaerobaculia bacterium]|nr:TlpA disulfide reductase family protein [Thermoanaerobaculia bacterium]